MSDSSTVRVRILDKEYQVACPPEEREELIESARYLDQQMRSIRQGGKVIGMERIAVMAALNISHQLIQGTALEQSRANDLDQRLQKLCAKLDDTIHHYNQIEI